MSSPVLTEQQKQRVLVDFLDRVPVAVIAARYGVHRTYPTNLARRRGLLSPKLQRQTRLWRRAQGKV